MFLMFRSLHIVCLLTRHIPYPLQPVSGIKMATVIFAILRNETIKLYKKILALRNYVFTDIVYSSF